MALEISVVHDQVLAFNPALLLYAAAQLCRIFETPQEANPAGLPLRLHVPWRTEQHRNSRYELAPLHSISSWQLRMTDRISRLDGHGTHCGFKTASQVRRVTQDGYRSFAHIQHDVE